MKIRVATAQYHLRPLKGESDFADQLLGIAATAADYGAQLLVLPEYFTAQLLTLGDPALAMTDRIWKLADRHELVLSVLREQAKKFKLFIVGGSIPVLSDDKQRLFNESLLVAPTGKFAAQRKLHLTRFESEEWHMSPGEGLRVFETALGKLMIAICYDVEFPELIRAGVRLGAELVVVPSCTDDQHGFLRVRYCCQARAVENQCYVIQSPTVGGLSSIPACALNYGQAAVFTPCDRGFPRDGILAEGVLNQESVLISDLDFGLLAASRSTGTVFTLRDSEKTSRLSADPKLVKV